MNTQSSPCSLVAPHLVGETRACVQHSVVPTGSNPGALTEAQGLDHLALVNLSSHITHHSHLLTLALSTLNYSSSGFSPHDMLLFHSHSNPVKLICYCPCFADEETNAEI